MKLDIQANDFCPDNCPYCEPIFKGFSTNGHEVVDDETVVVNKLIPVWECRQTVTCEYANKQRKDDLNAT